MVPEQQTDLLISCTLPSELPKNWVRPWLGMAAIKRPIPAPNSTVPVRSTRIGQRENIGWEPPPQQLIGIEQAGGPELPSEAILDHNCRAGDEVPEFTANDIRGNVSPISSCTGDGLTFSRCQTRLAFALAISSELIVAPADCSLRPA